MGKNNVNPDHYKVAGRGRQGQGVVHQVEKRKIDTRQPERAGISNRLSPKAEARMLEKHPPVDTSSPPPVDAAGRVGEQPLEDRRDRQTSHKAGSRSIAQKEAGARYPDRSMPASRKVAGAFGREPQTSSPGTRGKKRTTKRARRNR